LETAVEGRTVNEVYGWVDGQEVCGELLGLLEAIAGERWVGWDACGTADGGAVFAGLRVDDPVGAVLLRLAVASLSKVALQHLR